MSGYTKESLIEGLKAICNSGWIQSCRASGNDGAVGNTVERLLGIKENNLSLADAGEWEIKGQRRGNSLLTLFHFTPWPRWPRRKGYFNTFLLPNYGWPLNGHPEEWSLRLTIGTVPPSESDLDRGFRIILDEVDRKVALSFQADKVAIQQRNWLTTVEKRVGLGEINPQPYWSLDELKKKIDVKLKNTFYLLAEAKEQNGVEYFWYDGIIVLEGFKFDVFLELLKTGKTKVDFDARTGFGRRSHDHGTKFRIPRAVFPTMYTNSETLLDDPMSKELLKIEIDTAKVHKIGSAFVISAFKNFADEGPKVVQESLFAEEEQ